MLNSERLDLWQVAYALLSGCLRFLTQWTGLWLKILIYGKRKSTNLEIVTSEAGSALCGAAPNMNALIIGRVIAGMGGAGVYIG